VLSVRQTVAAYANKQKCALRCELYDDTSSFRKCRLIRVMHCSFRELSLNMPAALFCRRLALWRAELCMLRHVVYCCVGEDDLTSVNPLTSDESNTL
jgi:hypothetical protein